MSLRKGIYKRGSLSLSGIKNFYSVIYQGKGISTNQYYSGGHWRTRQATKKKYGLIFDTLLKSSRIPKLDKFNLVMFYNSRHDSDNAAGLIKAFLDSFKEERLRGQVTKKGWVYDDSPEYLKSVHIVYDSALQRNTFEFIILEL